MGIEIRPEFPEPILTVPEHMTGAGVGAGVGPGVGAGVGGGVGPGVEVTLSGSEVSHTGPEYSTTPRSRGETRAVRQKSLVTCARSSPTSIKLERSEVSPDRAKFPPAGLTKAMSIWASEVIQLEARVDVPPSRSRMLPDMMLFRMSAVEVENLTSMPEVA